jgi:hypothetical protein
MAVIRNTSDRQNWRKQGLMKIVARMLVLTAAVGMGLQSSHLPIPSAIPAPEFNLPAPPTPIPDFNLPAPPTPIPDIHTK